MVWLLAEDSREALVEPYAPAWPGNAMRDKSSSAIGRREPLLASACRWQHSQTRTFDKYLATESICPVHLLAVAAGHPHCLFVLGNAPLPGAFETAALSRQISEIERHFQTACPSHVGDRLPARAPDCFAQFNRFSPDDPASGY